MTFIHLHVHSHYSLLDGVLRPEEIVHFAKQNKMPAIALTDHGNLYGAVPFMKAAHREGIKGILGCELYMVDGSRFDRDHQQPIHHLTVLVKNTEGYRNLLKLVSHAYTQGFYYKPRVDWELLENHHEGLIVLTGCMSGAIPSALRMGREEQAQKLAMRLKEIFGDDLYVEVMDHGLKDQKKALPGLIHLARQLSIDVVATNDVHYLHREDAKLQEILLCISTGKKLNDANRLKMEADDFYMKTPQEMAEVFEDLPEALENTVRIAEKVHFTLEPESHSLPHFVCPDGYSSINHYFVECAKKGLEERLRTRRATHIQEEVYRERLAYELDVITHMNFPSYFLIVADIINYARSQGIPVGPGRGSAAGSLVSWALKITDVDPLAHGLLFERFLNQERISLPDIDVDFCQRERARVIQYIKERYGESNVAQIVTFNTLKARSVIRDVARVMGMSYQEGDAIAKLIPSSYTRLMDAFHHSPPLQSLAEKNPKVQEVIQIGSRLEGLHRNISVHAAGVVITPEEVTNYVPLCITPKGDVVTQYDKNMLEYLNLLKMDILGLRTLTVLDDTVKSLPEPIDLASLPMDDEKTFLLFQEGKTDGVFQFESEGMKALLRESQPSRIEDLIALNALYRPGALQSNMVQEYVERKKGKKPITYLVDELKDILEETYGIIVYQEQVMKIAERIAGYALHEADHLRKAMGKKLPQIMQKERKRFIEGAAKKGYSKKLATNIFDFIEPFAGYGFNKSHSVAYAYLAYQTAYLKAHYPKYYMASLLTSEMNNTDKLAQYIQECGRMGIPIYPPDINTSQAVFKVGGEGISFALAAIKGVGEQMAYEIQKERERQGEYKGYLDLLVRLGDHGLNKKVLEALIFSGALDSFGHTRRFMVENLSIFQEMGERRRREKASGQLDLFGGQASSSMGDPPMEPIEEYESHEKLAREHEALGFFLSGHPLEKHESLLRGMVTAPIGELQQWIDKTVTVGGIITQVKVMKVKNGANKGKMYARFTLEDTTGQIQAILFPDLYQKKASYLETQEPLLVTGTIRGDEVALECMVSDILTLEEGKSRKIRSIILDLPHPLLKEQLEALREYILNHQGAIPLSFRYTKPGHYQVLIEPDLPFRVHATSEVLEWFSRHFGEGAYHLIY